MLGINQNILTNAQNALKQLTGQPCACTWPLTYCVDGQIVGYALDAYLPGTKRPSTYYFDTTWANIALLPAGATPCCGAQVC